MLIAYLIFLITLFGTIRESRRVIVTKKYKDLFPIRLSIPFFVFFFSTLILGGSAFNDAATDYELYQAGHYYLFSHGSYTEVTYRCYLYAKIMEIVGLACFGISFILSILKTHRNKTSTSQFTNQINRF